MACLAGGLYDPAVAVSKATTALLAMTALDTVNLRNTFTVPTNGRALVRMRGVLHGATTAPQVLLGVLEGATVMGRQAPSGHVPGTQVATTLTVVEALFVVAGLVAGNILSWDAAYGVETVVAGTGLKYGGPDNSTANNAFGGFLFEIWDA